MEFCREVVAEPLKDYSEDVTEDIAKYLHESIGVEKLDDLKFVTVEDLLNIMKPVPARKLMLSWKKRNEGDREMDSYDSFTESVGSSSSQQSNNIKVPWGRMPPQLIRSCELGVRPTPQLRKEMVRVVVDSIFEQTSNTGKQTMDIAAQHIVDRYPGSFKDSFDGKTYGQGHESLTMQLTNRAENLKRKMKMLGFTTGCKKMSMSSKLQACVGMSEDCNTNELIEETEDTKWLKTEYTKSLPDMNAVREKMELTYPRQRTDINKKLSVSDLKAQWPFLFKRDCLTDHYRRLTGKGSELVDSIEQKSKMIYSTLNSCSHAGMKEIRSKVTEECQLLKSDSPKTMHFIEVLCCFFKEDVSEIYRVAKVDEPLQELHLEPSPIVIVRGDSIISGRRFEVIIENCKVYDCELFQQAIEYAFKCFYVFNMEYPKSAGVTYEFLQRYFADIDGPCRGKYKKIHPEVLSLMRLLAN